MKPRLYLETSIISYQVARSSRDIITLARQQQTHDWWDRRRHAFDLFVSQIVLDEVAIGDRAAAGLRLDLIRGLPLLDVTPESLELARVILKSAGLPRQAGADALHIAVSTLHGMHFLLTWNSKQIANAEHRQRVEKACRQAGYEPPVLCTPDELMGEDPGE